MIFHKTRPSAPLAEVVGISIYKMQKRKGENEAARYSQTATRFIYRYIVIYSLKPLARLPDPPSFILF